MQPTQRDRSGPDPAPRSNAPQRPLGRRLLSAAVGAGAAASAAGPAAAAVIHIDFDTVVDRSSFDVDLDGDGHVDFVFANFVDDHDPGWGYNPYFQQSELTFSNADAKSSVLYKTYPYPTGQNVVDITLGDVVGPGSGSFLNDPYKDFLSYHYTYYVGGYCGYGCYGGTIDVSFDFGQWNKSSYGNYTAYLGFSFEIDGLDHYGWAQIRKEGFDDRGVLIDAAYSTVPGQSIVAGAVPEPSSIVLLAMGLTGLAAHRREALRRARPGASGAGAGS